MRGVAQLVRRHDTRAPALSAPGPGGCKPLVHPLADDIALHFSKCGLNLQKSPACRCCCVHRSVERPERNSPCGQLIDQGDQLARKPAEAIKIKHDQYITLAQKVEAGRKTRAIRIGAGGAIFEYPLASALIEGIKLTVEQLSALSGGNPCIPDQSHHETAPPRQYLSRKTYLPRMFLANDYFWFFMIGETEKRRVREGSKQITKNTCLS
jgi:hypothetical protein